MPAEPVPTILSAEFIAETRSLESLPPEGPPEVAIAGRSNVGKSSLLNRLAARLGLARTSKTPGRTRGLLFYDLSARFAGGGPAQPLRLVDFPGFGYAKVSKDERASWRALVEGYVRKRPTLVLFLVLVDARRGPEEEERQLVEWLAHLGVRQHVVVTKTDKLGASERGLVSDRIRAAAGPSRPPVLTVSSHTGDNIDRLWSIMRRAITPEGGGPAAGPKGDV